MPKSAPTNLTTRSQPPMTQTEITPLLDLIPWRIECCIRTLHGMRYLCPPTSQWADWRDDDAIRHHGVCVGQATPDPIRQAIRDTASLDAWDNQVHGRPVKTSYSPIEQFVLLHSYSVDVSQGG